MFAPKKKETKNTYFKYNAIQLIVSITLITPYNRILHKNTFFVKVAQLLSEFASWWENNAKSRGLDADI